MYDKKYYQNWLAKNREKVRLYKRNYQRKWRINNREKYLKQNRDAYYRHRKERNADRKQYFRKLGIELLKALGSKCQICGYNKNKCALDIHHIEGKNQDVRNHCRCRSRKQLAEFIEMQKQKKIMLLCANCHREEHHKDWET